MSKVWAFEIHYKSMPASCWEMLAIYSNPIDAERATDTFDTVFGQCDVRVREVSVYGANLAEVR